jgi:hypothetical protein
MIRITPESKRIITMPNWVKTAIPVFKFGHRKFKNRQTDQNDSNIIKELLKLSEEKSEGFSLNLEDFKNLAEEFLD